VGLLWPSLGRPAPGRGLEALVQEAPGGWTGDDEQSETRGEPQRPARAVHQEGRIRPVRRVSRLTRSAGGTRQSLVIPSLKAVRSSAGIRLRERAAVCGRVSHTYEVELDPGMMFVSGWMQTVDGRLDVTADRATRWLSTMVASVRRYPLDVIE
jgi:hypothetical protein